MSKMHLDIRVVGNKEELSAFVGLCKVIQYLGRSGSSRDIKLSVDGDGSGRLSFYGIMSEGKFVDFNCDGIDADNLPRISIGE
jgi:hypothetical protein